MYTWGYLKDSALANLDMTETEALQQNFLNKFIYWANEVITQVSSAVKPKRAFAEFNITKDDLFKSKRMPDDFVSFDADICTRTWTDEYGDRWTEECSDDDFVYRGTEVMFLREGDYQIAYNARWFVFDDSIDNNTFLDIPADILECIPTYIAMKCYKIDDEQKSAIFKNEYEVQLARIDDTHYKMNGTLKIGGDW